ncbi:MAG: HlyD family efflux transporter periplasmic adaptor subunit [Clostridia bacterium]|nr:HlyD family efflux transporter periplasmic adaptor subunit [Clostridia bacterium]
MKKKMMAILVMAAMALPVCAPAEGIRIDGTIEAVKTQSILAPHSGRVGDYAVRAGDELRAGEELFTISAQKVYADFDGRITGVFAQPGDSAASVEERYGALCYMERDTLYAADCTTSGAASDNENKIVHVGEIVHICSESNDKRQGTAVVTSVSGKNYTLEVLSYVDIRLSEDIEVYREENFRNASCIGRGDIRRLDPVAVTAQGYVRAVHVTDGQMVSRGDLLFEIVPDALEDMKGGDGSVDMPADGVVLSISAERGAQIDKDARMATVCRREDMQLVCRADEEDLSAIEPGMTVMVTLDAYRDAPAEGTVVNIAAASAEDGSSAGFDVTIRLKDNALVRVGMHATAEF